MQVLYKHQVDMDVINHNYKLLGKRGGKRHEIDLEWHMDIGPKDSDASRMYDKDHSTVANFMEEYYGDSGADIILVKGAIDRGLALSKRLFVCKTYAFRKLE
jgi:hypothetical protein